MIVIMMMMVMTTIIIIITIIQNNTIGIFAARSHTVQKLSALN